MTKYPHDMSQVPEMGSLPKEAIGKWLRFRIESGHEKDSKDSPGEKVWWYVLSCLDEPFVGLTLPVACSLRPDALFTLKAFYTACNYYPGPEGHDPDQILGCEIYAKLTLDSTNKVAEYRERAKLQPYNIRQVTEPLPLR